ncbi:MAG: hypothetical protein VX438_10845 [Planctomycetota bacterium]|nr:hypothetical protein [Planctomycetota bacterium]
MNQKNKPLMMEKLEGRELLAADIFLADGILEITGTNNADHIEINTVIVAKEKSVEAKTEAFFFSCNGVTEGKGVPLPDSP